MTPLLCLMGPTAAGKTAAAEALCKRFPLEVVSVDSALVYRGLDIGTAKPTPAQLRAMPHHLVDIIEPDQQYSAGRFRDDARAAIAAIEARGLKPLLVGGTGLYFSALLDGLSALPPADPAVRAALEQELAASDTQAMHRRLAEVDPASAARIRPSDPQRILRALEVCRISGRPLSALQQGPAGSDVAAVRIALAPADRAVLHARIAARFDAMLAGGLINETRALLTRCGHDRAPGLDIVGYRQVRSYLAGEIDRETLRARGIAATRQLAKRQLTWLRRTPAVQWVDTEASDALDRITALAAGSGCFD